MISNTPDAWSRMDAFQQVVHQWTTLHPSNAAHTYKIAGPLDLERFREAIRDTCSFNRLGVVSVGQNGCSFHHEADDAPEVEVLDGGEDFG